ncbi:putative tyrosine phosphatase [Scheffersomyces coipomensis]|uniref:putative tyrosine phosphatase n=1 Tax=Scheffersomyces coipomensis TaxID=1788519 RepID=UPI00315D9D9A
MLVPPENFGLVEAGIYRCSKLESDNFPFLETLKLKSLILLDAEKPPRTLNKFLDSNKIELFNLGGMKISSHKHTGDDNDDDDDRTSNTSKTSESRNTNQPQDSNTIDVISLHTNKNKNEQWMLIEKSIIIKSFEILLNKNKNNILLVDSSSTLVGILRKIQKWNFNSILNEYRIYTGNSSTSNYFAENFLELIQIELIPYEIDKLLHSSNSKPDSGKNTDTTVSPIDPDQAVIVMDENGGLMKSPNLSQRSSRFNSVDEDIQWEEDDINSIDDDDMDDDLLSASPQIPANLLKLVEQRKHEKSSRDSIDGESDSGIITGTSPRIGGGRSSRNNSFSNDLLLSAARMNLERRRSSIDSKFIRSGNTKFRNPSLPYPMIQGKSFEGSSPSQKKLKERDSRHSSLVMTELEMAKLKFEFKYYKNLNKFPIAFEKVSVLKLKLPAEYKLPDWFIRGRNFWEDGYNKLNDMY